MVAKGLNELIPVRQDGLRPTVNARDLHEWLQVGRDYTNWIKGRIDRFGFDEGKDFTVFAETGENPRGGRPAAQYHVTLDMAKELAMVERTARGRQARRYFIECERALREGAVQRRLPASYAEALRELAGAVERQQQLEGHIEVQREQIEALAPDAELARGFLAARNAVTSTQLGAKFGRSARWLNAWLQRHRRIWKVHGQWVLKGAWRGRPYMVTRHTPRRDPVTGGIREYRDSLWTPRGQVAVYELLKRHGIHPVTSTRSALMTVEEVEA